MKKSLLLILCATITTGIMAREVTLEYYPLEGKVKGYKIKKNVRIPAIVAFTDLSLNKAMRFDDIMQTLVETKLSEPGIMIIKDVKTNKFYGYAYDISWANPTSIPEINPKHPVILWGGKTNFDPATRDPRTLAIAKKLIKLINKNTKKVQKKGKINIEINI